MFDAVEAGEASFCVRPEALNAIDVDRAVRERTSFFAVLLDAEMLVVSDIDEPIIGLPAIRHHNAFKADLASDKSL